MWLTHVLKKRLLKHRFVGIYEHKEVRARARARAGLPVGSGVERVQLPTWPSWLRCRPLTLLATHPLLR